MDRNSFQLSLSTSLLFVALCIASCNKDDAEEVTPTPSGCATPSSCGTVADIDGNTYSTVQIGSQCWMAQNLKVSRYRNGDAIPVGSNGGEWLAITGGACAAYNDDPANESTFGKLYNWPAVADPRGLCPNGWHIATDDDWITLEITLGMSAGEAATDMNYRGQAENIGGELKGTSNWYNSSSTGANNCSGMNCLPGGVLGAWYDSLNDTTIAIFENMGQMVWMWTATEHSADQAMLRGLFRQSAGVWRGNGYKTGGLSCRCVAD